MSARVQHHGRTATIVLDEPLTRNAVTPSIATALLSMFDALEHESEIRAVILTGAGNHFCAGGDLRNMPPESPSAARSRLEIYASLVSRMRASRLPIVCGIDGSAAGIGVSLALACDVIVASERARFLLPFSTLGLFPDGGLIPLLAERVGAGQAKALLLLARPISAAHAHSRGLVDEVCEPSQLSTVARHLAEELASRAPLSIERIKQLFAAGTTNHEYASEFEIKAQSELYFSADFAAGREAFFTRTTAMFAGR